MTDGQKKGVVGVVVVVAVGLAVVSAWRAFHEETPPSNTRTLMDAETGKLFEFPVDEKFGPFPMKNPKTGKNTLYPTEVCFHGECLKRGGTHVIMNDLLPDKEGPTHCPVCGHIVRFHNPGPPRESEE